MVVQLLVTALKFSLMAVTFERIPPLAVNSVAGLFIHTVAVAGVTVTAEGSGFVVIITVSVATQPLFAPPERSVPVTVYVVVEAGLTVTGVPGKLPGVHTYV